jgi:hypothetical protein
MSSRGKVRFWAPALAVQSVLAATLLLSSGCIQTRLTEPKRSAVEQLLLSTATDNAMQELVIPEIHDKRVYVDPTFFESYDREYALGTIRDVLSLKGALLVRSIDQCEIVVEPRAGALSIDSSESLVGIPSMPVPIPFTGTFQSPELYLFKSENQFSTAKIALLAYERETGQHVRSTGSLVGKARHRNYIFLGYIRYTSTSIPEKQRGSR